MSIRIINFAKKWGIYRPFNRPADFNSGIDSLAVNTPNFAPFRDSFTFINNVVSSVARLFFHGGPFAISGAVIPIHVNSVNCKVVGVSRCNSPISECFKTIFPFGTDCYPTPTISRITYVFFIIATAFHVSPNMIKAGMFLTMGTFCVSKVYSTFRFETTARMNPISTKTFSCCDDIVAAITNAIPSIKSIYLWGLRKNSKTTNFFVDKINLFWHYYLCIVSLIKRMWRYAQSCIFSGATLATPDIVHIFARKSR